MCNFAQRKGEVLKAASVLIIDEVTMLTAQGLDVLSRSLCDLRQCDALPMGGLVTVFGGDFRQVLPVVRRSGRAGVVRSTVLKSSVWPHVKVLKLTENVRLRLDMETADDVLQMAAPHYANFILRVGEGCDASPITLPPYILRPPGLDHLIEAVFDDFSNDSPEYWSSRAVLSQEPRCQSCQ